MSNVLDLFLTYDLFSMMLHNTARHAERGSVSARVQDKELNV